MNSLIVFPEEVQSENKATLTGTRAEYAYEVHELRTGLDIKAALCGSLRGQAQVIKASKTQVELELNLKEEAPPRNNTILIVATPRPQTVKKILQAASCLGLLEVHFIRTANVVKSYFQSKALLEENIQFEVLKGLEQAYDPIAPKVTIHKFFKPFITESLPSLVERYDHAKSFIADTGVGEQCALGESLKSRSLDHAFLAIGPESGWTASEVEQFKAIGFESFSLGERMLRVETATVVALGQIDLLRRQ